MKIAIDITPLESGHAGRGTGIYTSSLINALQKYESNNSYIFFTRGQKVPGNADLVHYPYFDPFFLTLPLLTNKPFIVTVHDLIPLDYPEYFQRGIRGEIKWIIQKVSLRNASGIITVSHASKKSIIKHTGFNENNVRVIYEAPPEEYGYGIDKTFLASVRQKYSLPVGYILYVGDVNRNKNIPGLIKSFDLVRKSPELPEKKRRSLKLVLAGRAFLNTNLSETTEINTLISRLNLEKYTVRPGFIEKTDLQAFYSLAEAYVQPSFAEGFGLTPLEAMASGCPVALADNTSLSEIAGPSLKFKADNTDDMADKILSILTMSGEKRKTLISDGTDWAKKFSWGKTARETTKAYESVLGKI
jgi:glycosyltransferase involved in cell wall biosynthesis